MILASMLVVRRWRRTNAVRRYVTHTDPALGATALMVGSVIFVCAFQSGASWHLEERSDKFPEGGIGGNAPGALVVEVMPRRAATRVTEFYRSLDGRGSFFVGNLDTGRRSVTAVAPSLARCAASDPDFDIWDPPVDCTQDTRSRGVMYNVGEAPTGGTIAAAPVLIEGGRVGFLVTEKTSDGERVVDVASYKANPDPRLGERMPGVAIPRGHPAEKALGALPMSIGWLFLPDYGSMDAQERSRVLGAVLQFAPTAVPSSIEPDTGAMPLGVHLWGFGGAAAVLTFLAVFLLGYVGATGWVREDLVQFGASRRMRRRIAAEMLLPLAAAPLVALAVAWGVLELLSIGVPVGFGPVMLVPAASSTALIGVVGWVFSRAPRTVRSD